MANSLLYIIILSYYINAKSMHSQCPKIILNGTEEKINSTTFNCNKEYYPHVPISVKIENNFNNTQDTCISKDIFEKRENINQLKNIGIITLVIFFLYISIYFGFNISRRRKRQSHLDVEKLQAGIQCDPENQAQIQIYNYYDLPMTNTTEYTEICEKKIEVK